MIMEELEDVDKAIEFAKEQDDAELWEDLISYSIDKPRTIKPSHNILTLCLFDSAFLLSLSNFHNIYSCLFIFSFLCLLSIYHWPP